MNPWIAYKVSYRALKANKARAMLTTLGIIIGVAAVITMVALTNGAKHIIEDQLVSLGGRALIINAGSRSSSGVFTNKKPTRSLTSKDADAIRNLPMITQVSPIIDTASQIITGNKNRFAAVVGVGEEFPIINDWFPEMGNFFIAEDVERSELVGVLGKTVALSLFGYQNPVGKTVRIAQSSFKIIGVLSSKGQTPSGKDQDDIVIVPYTTFQKRIMRINHIEDIAVSVRTPEDIPRAIDEITHLLRERHKISPGMADDFYVKSQQHVTKRIFSISKIMTILLASVASVSLIVGGIGIMNIMLVSVTERTKEIGIRIAVGARQRDIRTQFLIESIMLSISGGLIGILIGIVSSKISSALIGWPAVISIPSVLIAFGFSACIGIFFGIYPAIKASKLDPIEALRYE